MKDYYDRFSEKDKIRLLNDRDAEILELDNTIEDLKEAIKELKANSSQLKAKVKVKASQKKNDTSNLSSLYCSGFIDVVHYTTEDDGTEYYELPEPDIANELFKDSEYHLVDNSRVKVYIEIQN